tara:strand:+ start:1399 stop:2655 length:1257 start_codon:yes stop_codon:yes gene_type:complete
MRIFKFGGASVKDAAGVQRVASIVQHFTADDILIVVSAMGKTTNALEELVKSFLNGKKEDCSKQLKDLKDSHQRIIDELFPQSNERLSNEVSELFLQLETIVESPAVGSFNQVYDQIVGFGELISTKIVSAYLNFEGFENRWLDARKLIRTDQNYRAARVNWNLTRRLVLDNVKSGNSYITQGFIGSDDNFNPTTLGREGSDYTASVIAYVLQAEEVTIWKDVPGVLNGDPKVFQGTELLKKISFREAIELAFYGASVIHPKTIQPLQERGVPLRVRSFSDLEQEGTTISEGVNLEPFLPCFIRKSQQQLISLATRDLAFIAEDHLSKIYKLFHEYGLRVNLSQHAATSSSFCVNDDPIATPALLEQLKQSFDVSVIGDLELYTVRHYDNSAVADIQSRGRKLLEQVSTDTYQIVIRI